MACENLTTPAVVFAGVDGALMVTHDGCWVVGVFGVKLDARIRERVVG